MNPLRLTSCQAINTYRFSRELCTYLGQRLGVEVDYVEDIDWRLRYEHLGEQKIDIGYVCAQAYVDWRHEEHPPVELLATPVWVGDVYADQPVYFAHIVVRKESPFRTFADLHEARWGANALGSLTGYESIRYRLGIDENKRFKGSLQFTGGHAASLRAIRRGTIDAAAIDSTFYDWMLAGVPQLANQYRIVESIGPNPGPPLVVGQHLPLRLREELRACLLGMVDEPAGAAILSANRTRRFEYIDDSAYDPIREINRIAAQVSLEA